MSISTVLPHIMAEDEALSLHPFFLDYISLLLLQVKIDRHIVSIRRTCTSETVYNPQIIILAAYV